ncbi:hypothetical protein EJ06DRAFT_519375 [Trichodelitschia bisporula]|uniref:Uncharacterized protein n=1 Tax=Trichodelitschia bisporula TaxID=703511 RepID=A0A6G1I6F2_9PEZI|nr:hypothetical protein EJ06DRAFT_519375 [Trichodelitschia bisporula]
MRCRLSRIQSRSNSDPQPHQQQPPLQPQASSASSTSVYSPYLHALQQIDGIPVPDLAATLTNPAEDAANDAHLTFRTPVDPQGEWRAQNAESFAQYRLRMHTSTSTNNPNRMAQDRSAANDDRARRERLHRVLARLHRLHGTTYGDRIPTHNSLYDWSPASEGEDEEMELQAILRELRSQQPNATPESLRVLGQTQLEVERERRTRSHASQLQAGSTSQNPPSSLYSAAILRAVRQHSRASARSPAPAPAPDYTLQYTMDRERYTTEPEEYTTPTQAQPRPEPTDNTDPRPRMRRTVITDPFANGHPPPAPYLSSTIKYLADIRSSLSLQDSIAYGADAGIERWINTLYCPAIVNIFDLPPLCETSLLAPGTVFSGQQRANPDLPSHTAPPGGSSSNYQRRWELDWRWESPRIGTLPHPAIHDIPSRWTTNTYPGSSLHAYRSPHTTVPPHAGTGSATGAPEKYPAEQWPVTVTIHSVDYERMTLAATMKAYEVPTHPQPTCSSIGGPVGEDAREKKSITTYLEGELIDFRTHTLLTESFKSSPANDATYWRKLEPFKDMSDKELLRRLLSAEYLRKLGEEYVLMRWKERCFVKAPGERVVRISI